jgi:hypothetical protein
MVEMQYVESSNIEAVGYDEKAKELHVLFRSGATYVYHAVPSELHQELMSAPSKGSFLNRAIKGAYTFTKM